MYVPVTGDFAIDPRNVPLAVQANTFASCLKRGGNGNIVPTARGYRLVSFPSASYILVIFNSPFSVALSLVAEPM